MNSILTRVLLGATFFAMAALGRDQNANAADGAEGTTAASATTSSPTLYDVSGEGLHITYATGAADGVPHLHLSDSDGERDFSGPEIRTVASGDVGTLVSVTIVRTIDSGSTSLTLVVPPVVLEDAAAPVTLVGVTTHHRFSVVPMFNRGQIDSYSTIPLSGTASR